MNYIRFHIDEIITAAIVFAILYLLFYILHSKKRRLKFAFYFNFVLCKLGLKKRMSRKNIGMVRTMESYEPLVELVRHPKIIINKSTIEEPVLLRKKVALRLYKIADRLPEDMYIKIYSAYRSRIKLYEIWKEELGKMEHENPNLGRAELLLQLKHKVTSPNVSMGGHDTGAAVDLALCDADGNELDFGTKYHEKNTELTTLTKEQKNNQKYIQKVMKSQDFVQYPGQWWHYSYGDRYWAAYKGKRQGAFYGSAEKEFENTGYVAVIKKQFSSLNAK